MYNLLIIGCPLARKPNVFLNIKKTLTIEEYQSFSLLVC